MSEDAAGNNRDLTLRVVTQKEREKERFGNAIHF